MKYQITCVTMSNGGSEHEHITHVGVLGIGTMTIPQVVNSMRRGDKYFVKDAKSGIEVEVSPVYGDVIIDSHLRKNHCHIRTNHDGKSANNLLELPNCPPENK